ncbi:TPA: ISAs1 family transposase, partial [Streptococcus pyogenes]|nr:ISAs1 family transposase [Streptococcus pyogenes]
TIDIRKSIVTIDAMGTQTAIVDTIIKGKADYCLAVKGNQETLYDDIALYFSDVNLLEELQENAQYYQTVEKSRGQIEVREYWVFSDIKWLCQNHPKWHKLRGHWQIESMHWLLDVVYHEDHHQTLDKRAAFNLNLIRKMCLYFLKVMVFPKKDLSYRRKQRYISVHLEDYLVQLFGERG